MQTGRLHKMAAPALMVLSCAFGASCSKDLTESNKTASPPSVGVKTKLVVTHVMPCLAVGAVNGRNETHLSVEPSRANGQMAQHIPEYVANYGKPLEAARQDIAMMREAGVDAMAMLLCNRHMKSQFAPMINAYCQAAVEDGVFKFEPDLWGDISKPDEYAEDVGALYKYEKAWLKRGGRLVVSLWMNYGSNPLPPYKETTDKLFSKIGGRANVFLVLYSPKALKERNPEWFAGADAFTDWIHDSYGLSHTDLLEFMRCVKESGKECWAPVMPAFAQSRYPHENSTFNPNVREKLGMTWFRESWLSAIEADAPATFIATWNDLSEDSSLMPETNHGYAYFELNKYYAAWFKTGRKPEIKKEQLLVFHHPQIVEGLKLPEGVKPMMGFPANVNVFNVPPVNRTPPTDYVGVVAMLQSPAKVAVMLGETVIGERECPAGLTSWLIYQPRNLNDPGKIYPIEDPGKAYPKEEQDFAITKLDKPFWDAEVYLSITRGAERIGFFRSHRPIAGAAGRGDMTTVGDAFTLENTPRKR